MEYFKSGLKTVLGAQQGAQQPSGAETVERLVERVQTSTLLDDRRDACRALKALSKKFRLEVGAQGMDVLIRVLETDRSDTEIVGYALDALTNIIAGVMEDEEVTPEMAKESENLGVQFTEIYIKKPENVSLLLDLLEEHEFKVRWPTVKLMTGLLIHRAKEMQEIILVIPMGVSRLMDLLVDSREVIRNDALLLLAHLTRANANIQKIVAFENAFDRLLDIISEEGYSDGGVIVEDCLLVLLNLLKNNVSNQNFFKEGSYIQKLKPFFDLNNDPTAGDKGWSAQKVGNIHMMLQLIRTLVSPNNPLQVISSCQKVMFQSELLKQLCNILMASGVPADILTETINTVAEVIRGYHSNQEYLAGVTAPANPPRPAIVVLLMSMVNEKQPFVLRCAVLYCFQCFLYKNELGQAQVIQTLLPSTADMTSVTAGQLLCGGLFSSDSLSNWFASVALSHALVDNQTQKEQLLRVQLAISIGNPPISLMKQCTSILQQGVKIQTRLGLLMLLSTWLANCNVAVSHFLSLPTNIPYLTSQVGLAEGDEHEDLVQGLCAFLLGICIEFNDGSDPTFTKESLCQLIVKRVGLESFLDKLGSVMKSDKYSQAVQKPNLKYKHPSEVLFDYEFCRLFKSLEGTIIKAVQPKPQGLVNGPESNLTAEQCSLLKQYKELIREQDQQLSELRQKLEELEREHQHSESRVQDLTSSVQQLRDQNALLKAQRVATSTSNASQATEKQNESDELQQLKQELEDLSQQNKMLSEQLLEARMAVEQSKEDPTTHSLTTEPLSQEAGDQISIDSHRTEVERLQQTIKTLEDEVTSLKERNQLSEAYVNKLSIDRKTSMSKMLRVNEKNKKLEEENKSLKEDNEKLDEELSVIRKEQEDLLVLLTEQDTKLTTFKKRLKELGEKIDDDDDDLQDDDEDTEAEVNES